MHISGINENFGIEITAHKALKNTLQAIPDINQPKLLQPVLKKK